MTRRTTLTRRTMLRGMGASLALPWLESMRPAMAGLTRQAAEAAAKPPVRMSFWYVPNGVHLPTWFPEREGVLVNLPETHTPLEFCKDDLVFFHGLSHSHAETNGDTPGCGHGLGAASFLTGAQAVRSQDNVRVGVSADQLYASHVGNQTRFPSLELGCEPARSGNAFGYSGTYKTNISWRSPTTPAPYEINPKIVFDRLFTSRDQGLARGTVGDRDFYRKSLLDYVMDDAARLQHRVSQSDRQKLDQYMTGVREVERRIQNSATSSELNVGTIERPEGVPQDIAEHMQLLCDLQVLAFQTDSTRVSSFMVTIEASNRNYPFLGFTDGHHELSHHGNDDEKNRKLRDIDRFHISVLARMIEKMKAIPEGDGTLFDNAMILYGSGISDGDRHDHVNLPILVAGSGGGRLKTGQHIRCRTETPMSNILLAMLQAGGVPIDQFGDSTESLRGLT